MILDTLLYSALVPQSFIIALWKVHPVLLTKGEVIVDLVASGLMALMFLGTQGGALIALIGGLIFSIEIRLIRRWLERKHG